VKELLKKGSVTASMDLFPDKNLKQLDEYFTKLFEEGRKKLVKKILKELLQKKLSETILRTTKLPIGDVEAHSVTKVQRRALVHALKDIQFPITGTMGLDWAIVADGGVDPKEVDFKSMTSRIHKNVYLIGDTLDINRPSGGFSLQLCWTTGFVAGTHAAQSI
jgi:predicted flavoprotein YhiN